MNTSVLEAEVMKTIDTFRQNDAERMSNYERAIERYNNLESRGLLKKRGNLLLPIEDRHRLSPVYRNNKLTKSK